MRAGQLPLAGHPGAMRMQPAAAAVLPLGTLKRPVPAAVQCCSWPRRTEPHTSSLLHEHKAPQMDLPKNPSICTLDLHIDTLEFSAEREPDESRREITARTATAAPPAPAPHGLIMIAFRPAQLRPSSPRRHLQSKFS
jgi:hypothetical protein